MELTPKELFETRIPRGLKDHPDIAQKHPVVLQFDILGEDGGTWTVDTKVQPATCAQGPREDADCRIELTSASLLELIQTPPSGRASAVMRFILEGTIDMDGDVAKAMKLSQIFALADARRAQGVPEGEST